MNENISNDNSNSDNMPIESDTKTEIHDDDSFKSRIENIIKNILQFYYSLFSVGYIIFFIALFISYFAEIKSAFQILPLFILLAVAQILPFRILYPTLSKIKSKYILLFNLVAIILGFLINILAGYFIFGSISGSGAGIFIIFAIPLVIIFWIGVILLYIINNNAEKEA